MAQQVCRPGSEQGAGSNGEHTVTVLRAFAYLLKNPGMKWYDDYFIGGAQAQGNWGLAQSLSASKWWKQDSMQKEQIPFTLLTRTAA